MFNILYRNCLNQSRGTMFHFFKFQLGIRELFIQTCSAYFPFKALSDPMHNPIKALSERV